MTEQYKRSLDALKDFVRVHLLLLEWKRAAAQSLTLAKPYTDKSKKLMEQFKEKRRKLKSELTCEFPERGVVEKRYREMRFLQAETLKLQRKLDEVMRLRKKPAIQNANEKWRTRDDSPDSEAVSAAVVAASKSGEACTHQTQFVQDRRLSDSFDFAVATPHFSVKPTTSDKDCEDQIKQDERLDKTYTKRSQLVSHILVDDLRRLVANELYDTETKYLNLSATDLELCKITLNNNNDIFVGKRADS